MSLAIWREHTRGIWHGSGPSFQDELRLLLAAARDNTRPFYGLTGADRYHLYATACGTGFRASALASLTPESFDLDADAPVVTLAARHAKNRRTKVQPLAEDLAGAVDKLLPFLPGVGPAPEALQATGTQGAPSAPCTRRRCLGRAEEDG